MSRPWMKFYPTDWQGDPKLRACSLGARGLWMEMLCIMSEADPIGHLLIGKSSPTLKQLASISGSTLKEINKLLAELEAADVFSRTGDKNEIIYSRRMVRDAEKAARDKANGYLGGNPDLMPGVNPPDKAQIPDTRKKKEEEVPSSLRSDGAEDQNSLALEPMPSPQRRPNLRGPPEDPAKVELYRRGGKILGRGSGALVTKLLKVTCGDNVAAARLAIEQCAAAGVPREYLAGIMRDREREEAARIAGNSW